MTEAGNIECLHESLIWNSSFRCCKSLVLIKYRCQTPFLEFSQTTNKTTSPMLQIPQVHTLNYHSCFQCWGQKIKCWGLETNITLPRLQWIRTGWFFSSEDFWKGDIDKKRVRIRKHQKKMWFPVFFYFRASMIHTYLEGLWVPCGFYGPEYSQMAPDYKKKGCLFQIIRFCMSKYLNWAD